MVLHAVSQLADVSSANGTIAYFVPTYPASPLLTRMARMHVLVSVRAVVNERSQMATALSDVQRKVLSREQPRTHPHRRAP